MARSVLNGAGGYKPGKAVQSRNETYAEHGLKAILTFSLSWVCSPNQCSDGLRCQIRFLQQCSLDKDMFILWTLQNLDC
eukprot:5157768-Amphidinium_carterae.2